jgi:hypothetical protein
MIWSSVCPFFGLLNLLDFFRGPQLPQYLYFQLVQLSGFGSTLTRSSFFACNKAADHTFRIADQPDKTLLAAEETGYHLTGMLGRCPQMGP